MRLHARTSSAVGASPGLRSCLPLAPACRRGSVLVIVLWISLGLVVITIYFAQSMSFELRASDNRVSGLAADQAIEGAARYVNYVLANLATNGLLPDIGSYQREAVPVGEAHFWLLGRDTNYLQTGPTLPSFSLIDEASKLNINTAPSNMLVWLPRMTLDLVSAILDWRTNNGGGGGTVDYYSRLRSPYLCKGAAFETVDELRLVYGTGLEILYGEDANLNGILDANENDGEATLPYDNRDSRLDPGLLEYLTVYSSEPNTTSNGTPRVNVSDENQLTSILQTNFSTARANEILANLGFGSSIGGGRPGPGGTGNSRPGGGTSGGATVTFSSLLGFYRQSRMTLEEFSQIADNITVSTNTVVGRVNINTASVPVLTCLLDGDFAAAQQLVNYRLTNPDKLTSVAWVVEALGQDNSTALQALSARDCITTQSYQFTADVAALGPHGRGYRRTRFVFDTTGGTPKIIYRQELSHLGWALGPEVRALWLAAKDSR